MDKIQIRSGYVQVDFPANTYNVLTNGWFNPRGQYLTLGNITFKIRKGMQAWATVMMGQGTVKFTRDMPDANYAVAFCTSGIHNAYRMTIVITEYRPDSFSYAWAINAIQPNDKVSNAYGPTPFRPMYRPLIHWVAVHASDDNQPYIRMINPQHHSLRTINLRTWFNQGGGINDNINDSTRVMFYVKTEQLTKPYPDGKWTAFGSLTMSQHGYGLMLTSWAAPDLTDVKGKYILTVAGVDNYMINYVGNHNYNTDWHKHTTIPYTDRNLIGIDVGSFDIVYTGFTIHESISKHPEFSKFIRLTDRSNEIDQFPRNIYLGFENGQGDNLKWTMIRGSACIFSATTIERPPVFVNGQTTFCAYFPSNQGNRTMFQQPSDMIHPLSLFANINQGLTYLECIRYWIYIDDAANGLYRVYYFPTGANTQGTTSSASGRTGRPIVMFTLEVSHQAWMLNWSQT